MYKSFCAFARACVCACSTSFASAFRVSQLVERGVKFYLIELTIYLYIHKYKKKTTPSFRTGCSARPLVSRDSQSLWINDTQLARADIFQMTQISTSLYHEGIIAGQATSIWLFFSFFFQVHNIFEWSSLRTCSLSRVRLFVGVFGLSSFAAAVRKLDKLHGGFVLTNFTDKYLCPISVARWKRKKKKFSQVKETKKEEMKKNNVAAFVPDSARQSAVRARSRM